MTNQTSKDVRVSTTCIACDVDAVITVPYDALVARYEGALMQDAFPFLSPEIREFFFGIRMCPLCWDKTFAEGE